MNRTARGKCPQRRFHADDIPGLEEACFEIVQSSVEVSQTICLRPVPQKCECLQALRGRCRIWFLIAISLEIFRIAE